MNARALHAEHARRNRTHPLLLLLTDPKPQGELVVLRMTARALHAEHARRNRTHPLLLLLTDLKPQDDPLFNGGPEDGLPAHWCEHEGHRHKKLKLNTHHGDLSSPEEYELERRRRRRRRRRKQLAENQQMRHKHRTLLVSAIDEQAKVIHVLDPDELPRRARYTIMVTACLLLFLCLLLVGVTLRMAPLIDDMGKS
ncbi:hypothetical protein NE865_03506 [Phthorimaea operculella]|nr:hypothetical protein NE865_03506 [Phthorimaea operculella]